MREVVITIERVKLPCVLVQLVKMQSFSHSEHQTSFKPLSRDRLDKSLAGRFVCSVACRLLLKLPVMNYFYENDIQVMNNITVRTVTALCSRCRLVFQGGVNNQDRL